MGVPLAELLIDRLDDMPAQTAAKVGLVLSGTSMAVRNDHPFKQGVSVPDELARIVCKMAHGEACALTLRVHEARQALQKLATRLAKVEAPEDLPDWVKTYVAEHQGKSGSGAG